MIVIATGITGSGRASYVRKVVEYARGMGKKIDFIDIGPKMFEKARQLRVNIPHNKILDLDSLALSFLRATTFEEVVSNADKYKGDEHDLIISLHASFRWRKVLLPAFDFYYLRRLEPDFYVTIVNSAYKIREEIHLKPDLRHWLERLTLREILTWQDEEVFTTKIMADFQAVPHYIVSGSDDPYTLYKIIYDVEKRRKRGEKPVKKAYLSYPMTMVRGNKDIAAEKDELVRKLKEMGIVVFDPSSVEDMVLVEELERSEGDEVRVPSSSVTIPRSEVEEARQYIIEQTVVRDYRLIDQSDMVIVFYPVKELSAGVLSEMIYAYTHQKDVYAIFPHKVSPFFLYYTTKMFKTVDEALEFLKEQA